MEEHQDMKNKMIVVAIISVVFAVSVIIGVMRLAQQRINGDETGGTGQQATEEDAGPQTGTLQLLVKDNATLSRGKPVTLLVRAHSFGTTVTAYDAVIHYDPKKLAFTEAKSLQNGMELIDTDQEMEDGTHELIITGVQSLARQEPFVFDNADIAEITFTALQQGSVNMTLEYKRGSNRDSNLFDNSTNEILSGVEGVTLVIQ